MSTAQESLGYTGEWQNTYTNHFGVLYLRARWYQPHTGRFFSPDPIIPDFLNPQSINQFAYVLGNPANLVDPSGFTSIGPGFIERAVTPHVVPFVLSARGPGGGTGPWLEAATELPVVNEVYDEFRMRLINEHYLHRSVTDLYRDVWFDSLDELTSAGFCGSNLLLECAHVSLVVLGKIAVVDRHEGREVFPAGFANLPGYIPNGRATDPRDRQGADTATHFFSHAFLSFEMLYSDEMFDLGYEQPTLGPGGVLGPTTGQQMRDVLGLVAGLMGRKAGIVNQWYAGYAQEYGFEDYYYWSQGNRAQLAYDTAVFAGNLYEIASTAVLGGNLMERMWNLLRMSDEELREILLHSDPSAAGGLQDVGVFRDLRANRRGANFGVTAFYQPTTFPVGDPPYIDPPPR